MSKFQETKKSVTFKHEVLVEARAADFQPLASLGALDFDRLSTGDHKLELGFVKGGCCNRLVRAVVRDGVVVDLEADRCDDEKALSPELIGLAREAHRRLTEGEPAFHPAPVADFARAVSGGYGIGWFCIWICFGWSCYIVCTVWSNKRLAA